MTEYITKEQAIELLHYNSDEKCAAIIADVEELESADVVEVVRCKNCKHKKVGSDWFGNESLVCDYFHIEGAEWDVLVDKDDFCSNGERMDGEE